MAKKTITPETSIVTTTIPSPVIPPSQPPIIPPVEEEIEPVDVSAIIESLKTLDTIDTYKRSLAVENVFGGNYRAAIDLIRQIVSIQPRKKESIIIELTGLLQ